MQGDCTEVKQLKCISPFTPSRVGKVQWVGWLEGIFLINIPNLLNPDRLQHFDQIDCKCLNVYDECCLSDVELYILYVFYVMSVCDLSTIANEDLPQCVS